MGKSLEFAMFTRFAMLESVVTLYTPPTAQFGRPTDLVVLEPETALAVFERDFGITSLKDIRQYAGYWAAWEQRS